LVVAGDELIQRARTHLALAEVLPLTDREAELAAATNAARRLLAAKGNVALPLGHGALTNRKRGSRSGTRA
jgi:hypothetical protein